MNPNELRIGNFAKCHNKIVEVSGITRDWCFYEDSRCTWNHVKFIPLTEEWMLKFGFYDCPEAVGDYKIKLPDEFGELLISTRIRNAVLSQNEDIVAFPVIYYVHQFQNLYFVLTGKELQIND